MTLKWMYNILDALALMHKHNLYHRDIKPENMVVHKEPNGNLVIKLADFGEATNAYVKTIKTSVGTEYYQAPEVDGKVYDHKADCYSVGVTFFFMLEGQPPWMNHG